MSEPIVFISKHKIKQEKLDEFKQFFTEGMAAVEAEKPNTLFQYAYVNDDWTIVRFVHVVADARAFEEHLIGADDRSKRAYEFIDPISMEIFGSPGDKTLEMFKQMEAAGISLILWPRNMAGFIRLAAS
jgi:quinol monooxygenase YgiN